MKNNKVLIYCCDRKGKYVYEYILRESMSIPAVTLAWPLLKQRHWKDKKKIPWLCLKPDNNAVVIIYY
jgi:hypothetical protein